MDRAIRIQAHPLFVGKQSTRSFRFGTEAPEARLGRSEDQAAAALSPAIGVAVFVSEEGRRRGDGRKDTQSPYYPGDPRRRSHVS